MLVCPICYQHTLNPAYAILELTKEVRKERLLSFIDTQLLIKRAPKGEAKVYVKYWNTAWSSSLLE